MFCPVCYPASSPRERITQRYAPMSTILVDGKPYWKCNSCGAQIAQPWTSPPSPLEAAKAENAALKARVAALESDQRGMADQGALLIQQVEKLKENVVATAQTEAAVEKTAASIPIPTPKELPPAHTSVPPNPAD